MCGGRLTKTTALTTSRPVIFAASSIFQLLNQLLHAVAQASQIALISLSWLEQRECENDMHEIPLSSCCIKSARISLCCANQHQHQ
jgi:hypothetical protein